MTRNWSVLVSAGKKAVEREAEARWELGDLALEAAPTGRNGVNNGSADVLAKFADAIGIEPSTLRVYRAVALSWPPVTRVTGTSWSAHREAMANDAMRDLLANDAPPSGKASWSLSDLRAAAAPKTSQLKASPPPAPEAIAEPCASIGLHSLAEARHSVEHSLDEFRHVDLKPAERKQIKESIDAIEARLAWMRSYVRSGDRSFEAELERVLVRASAERMSHLVAATNREHATLYFAEDGQRLRRQFPRNSGSGGGYTAAAAAPQGAAFIVLPGYLPSFESFHDMAREYARTGEPVVYDEERWTADPRVDTQIEKLAA